MSEVSSDYSSLILMALSVLFATERSLRSLTLRLADWAPRELPRFPRLDPPASELRKLIVLTALWGGWYLEMICCVDLLGSEV